MKPLSPEELSLGASYIKTICGNALDASKAYLIESRLGPLAAAINAAGWRKLYATVRADMTGFLRA